MPAPVKTAPKRGRGVIVGVNDLATTHPSLAVAWALDLNEGLAPEDVTAGTARKAWWRAPCGHAPWQVRVANRTSGGTGCPQCGREQASFVEHVLYEEFAPYLTEPQHDKNVPVRFLSPRSGKEPSARVDISGRLDGLDIAVEYDGQRFHEKRFDVDGAKTRALLDAGYFVARVRSDGLAHLPIEHPRLLQLDFTHRFGRSAEDRLRADLKPAVNAILATAAQHVPAAAA